MTKFMQLLTLLGILFILCCKGYKISIEPNNAQPQSRTNRTLDNLQKEKEETQEKINLTAEEKKKFDSLKHAFEKVTEKLQDQIQGCQNNKSKCTGFLDWLDGDIKKQKELANAFTTAYNFLDKKRSEKDSGKNFDQYISEALECKNSDGSGKYGQAGTNEIEQFFRGILNDMSNKNNNEEMFDCLKKELLGANDSQNHLEGLKSWQ
ncbi:Mlp family lipoprotein [Borrelia turicatae]|uniref:Mlp family lipoprotein n=1 Tax=Borrelia turicatae TaxID=142 RepID=UPI001FF58161|nr:Mlp family lipoprotein [Borrelia turicatae]UPA15358.1 Mlp family lipoprotein [Borrelia turicatae]